MREALRAWFEAEARPLPWRVAAAGARDPYVTLVVETMAQQTRIETVVARLPAFLARFPSVAALAAADVADVLAAWSGLGYYRRARALHACARGIVTDHGGHLPADPAALAALPGIGPYTAAALAAQAFGRPGIAVDGNVRRVGARVLGAAAPTDGTVRLALHALLLGDVVPAANAADATPTTTPEAPDAAFVAEALVELGATICTPRRPNCGRCPLRRACQAAATGDPTRFPTPRRRPTPRAWALHAWLVVRDGTDGPRVAIERRGDEGPWAGLHGPPWREAPPPDGTLAATFVHRLTHRTVKATVWHAARPPDDARIRWLAPHEAIAAGLSELDRRALSAFLGADAAR